MILFLLSSIIVTGFKNPLTFEKLWDLNPRDESANFAPGFHEYWEKELEKSR